MKISLRKAQSQLPKLARLAWEGEEIVITKSGEPYLLLHPYGKPRVKRKLGGLEGKIKVAPDFDETPPETVDSFWSSGVSPEERQ